MSGGLWLIGFRGAGKTELGHRLATELGWSFVDLDQEFEQKSGLKIVDYVAEAGIDAFRREEEKLMLAARWRLEEPGPGVVVATGGGCVDWAPSREILIKSARPKVFLDPPADELWARLQKEPERLKIGNLTDFFAMETLLEKRRPFYEKIATFRLGSQDISGCLAALKSLANANR